MCNSESGSLLVFRSRNQNLRGQKYFVRQSSCLNVKSSQMYTEGTTLQMREKCIFVPYSFLHLFIFQICIECPPWEGVRVQQWTGESWALSSRRLQWSGEYRHWDNGCRVWCMLHTGRHRSMGTSNGTRLRGSGKMSLRKWLLIWRLNLGTGVHKNWSA